MRDHVYLIAEAGVNHNGSLALAKKMIEVAVDAGADVVKFQTFQAKNIASKQAPKAKYQTQTTSEKESQLEMLQRLELNEEMHLLLMEHCKKCSIEFLSTPFDLDSIELLDRLGIELFKIPSGEITNLPYLRQIAKKKKPVIISTGMALLGEIEQTLQVFLEAGLSYDQITLLHCNTEYPTPLQDVNLRAMQTIASAFPGVRIGYSDHTHGIEIPIAAVAMGAQVIEKHFTLDRNMEGPDHKASLEPHELKAMVKAIRNVEQAFGTGIKHPSPSELKNKIIARKSIMAKRVIQAGELFSEDNLTVKRPGNGISPMRWDEIIGKKAIRNFQEDELIEL
ncbi:MAG: N-acetylneuraminate synthase [SAR324 cluster bacterium]|nr:N-acetylneuraminate synthase [SAR324 cluster bacterium]